MNELLNRINLLCEFLFEVLVASKGMGSAICATGGSRGSGEVCHIF